MSRFARIWRSVALLVLAASLCACGVRRDEAEAPFVVNLRAVQPQNISITNQKLVLSVDVLNPGPGERVLAHFLYTLELEGTVFVRGRVQGLRKFAPGSAQRLRIPATTTLEGLGVLLTAKSAGRPYRLSGHIVRAFTPGRFEFADAGTFSTIDIRPLKGAKPGL